MAGEVYRKVLRDQRVALLAWTGGFLLLTLLTLSFYPSIRDSPEINAVAENLPPAARALFGIEDDLGTATGFLRTRVFSLQLPLLLLIYAISRGSDAVAGEEDRGTLDLHLSLPVTRTRFLLEHAAAMATGVALLTLVSFASLALGARLVDMDVDPLRLLAAHVMALLLALLFGVLALAAGSAWGRRAWASGGAAAVAVASFVVDGLAELSGTLEPVELLSPFHAYSGGNPLKEGMPWGFAAALAGAALVFLAAAVVAFERRDLR